MPRDFKNEPASSSARLRDASPGTDTAPDLGSFGASSYRDHLVGLFTHSEFDATPDPEPRTLLSPFRRPDDALELKEQLDQERARSEHLEDELAKSRSREAAANQRADAAIEREGSALRMVADQYDKIEKLRQENERIPDAKRIIALQDEEIDTLRDQLRGKGWLTTQLRRFLRRR